MRNVARAILRGAGLSLVGLGLLHLAATPHIPHLLDGMKSEAAYQFAVGPTLLNHVLVGVLLLPLGYTTWLAAKREHVEYSWARRLLMINALATFSLPVALIVFMRQPVYYEAPMFVTAVVIVCVACAMIVVAAIVVLFPPGHASAV